MKLYMKSYLIPCSFDQKMSRYLFGGKSDIKSDLRVALSFFFAKCTFKKICMKKIHAMHS